MKKNLTTRALRVENLENREMLSATPFDATAAVEVATIETAAATIDLNGIESDSDVTFESTDVPRAYSMTWNAIEDAASYNLKISRDGGETFVTYAKPAENDAIVKGLWAGREYQFKIYGVKENGKLMSDPVEASFAPIDLASEFDSYAAGQTITVTLKGADSATAGIKWYSVTDEGETEIPEAENSLVYTPADASATIKVVATGTGVSAGSAAELSFAPIEVLDVAYDATTHVATISWNPVEDATSYRVRISRDGGETFITYAKDLTEPSAAIKGVYVGKSYQFKVIASNDSTSNLGEVDGLFAPENVTVNKKTFVAGTTITAKVRGSEDASADLQWYSSVDGEDWTAIEGATGTSYKVSSAIDDAFFVKVVATGTLFSTGSDSEAVVPRYIPVPETPSTTVTTAEDVVDEWDNVISLREAISIYAQAGDTVVVDESLAGATIALLAENGGFQIGSSLTIEGAGATIDASAIDASVFRVAGKTTTFSVSDLTIANASITANTAYGAAIYASDSDAVVLDNVTFSGNSVESLKTDYNAHAGGAALYLNATDARITNSTFDDNHVVNGTNGGAAILVGTGCDVTVMNTAFTNNSSAYTGTTNWATGGGAIAMAGYDNTLGIVGSTFTGNVATNATAAGATGGAIQVYSNVVNQSTYPTVTITDSTFDGNVNAVALYAYPTAARTSASITIQNSTFVNDTDVAIFNAKGSSPTCTIEVVGCEVRDNAVGVANAAAGAITVTDSTVKNNGADYRNTGTGEIIINESSALVDEAFADYFEEYFE